MTDGSAPVPGWYEDPQDPALLRWWDGSGWSEHTQATPVESEVVEAESTEAEPVISSEGYDGGFDPQQYLEQFPAQTSPTGAEPAPAMAEAPGESGYQDVAPDQSFAADTSADSIPPAPEGAFGPAGQSAFPEVSPEADFGPGQQAAGQPPAAWQPGVAGGGMGQPEAPAGFGAPQPGYGAPQSGYGPPQPGYGQPEPAFGQSQPGFGAPQPGFGQPGPPAGYGSVQPGYESAQPGYGQPEPQPGYGQPEAPAGYGAAQPGYGAPQPNYGSPEQPPGYGAPQPGFGPGQPQPGFGAPQPGYGQPEAPGAYGAAQPGFGQAPGGGYGQAEPEGPSYGSPQAGYGQPGQPQNLYGQPDAAGGPVPQPEGFGQPPAGYGQQPAGYGQPPVGYGQPPAGYGPAQPGYGPPGFAGQPGYGEPYGQQGYPMGPQAEKPSTDRNRLLIIIGVALVAGLILLGLLYVLLNRGSGAERAASAAIPATSDAAQPAEASANQSTACTELVGAFTKDDFPIEVAVRLQELAKNQNSAGNAAYFASNSTQLEAASQSYEQACLADVAAGKEPATVRTFVETFNSAIDAGVQLGSAIAAANAVTAEQQEALTQLATQLEQATAALPAAMVSTASIMAPGGSVATDPTLQAVSDALAAPQADPTGGPTSTTDVAALAQVPAVAATVDPFATTSPTATPTTDPYATATPYDPYAVTPTVTPTPTPDAALAAQDNAADQSVSTTLPGVSK